MIPWSSEPSTPHPSDPLIYDENGRLRIELPAPPDDQRFYPVTGAVLQGFVDQVNGLRDAGDQVKAERDRLRTALQAILPRVDMGYFCECPACIARPSPERQALLEARALVEDGPPQMHPTTRDLNQMEGP